MALNDEMSSRAAHKSIEAMPKLMRLINSKSIMDAKDDAEQRKREKLNN